MPIESRVPVRRFCRYNGSNGAEIVALFPSENIETYKIGIESEGGGVLVLTFNINDAASPADSTATLLVGDGQEVDEALVPLGRYPEPVPAAVIDGMYLPG